MNDNVRSSSRTCQFVLKTFEMYLPSRTESVEILPTLSPPFNAGIPAFKYIGTNFEWGVGVDIELQMYVTRHLVKCFSQQLCPKL